ncbi:hypothetical protein EG327_005314 [Venturia inaequalis]|uniref:Uncharacterized protein n=1 Tax=Venturia inaequalis TaxID=5025 RepID=A0A8H3VA20_VENIN|nr:hypothetical protein EG327_005314 [Venturia inaequalis]
MQFLSTPLARHTTSLKSLTSQPVTRFILAGTLFLSFLLLLWSAQSPHHGPFGRPPPPPPPHGGPPTHYPGSQHGSGLHVGEPSSSELRNWKKPAGMKIIGLVFYGRREFVEVLDCYLKRNLVRNGGVMDEVVFVVNTKNKTDLDYLDRIVNGTVGYKKRLTEGKLDGWTEKWELAERGNIYIKIDDDVLFFEDDAIAAIAKRMVENPHYFAVSANSVNNPALSWVHYNLGVYEPYLPETSRPGIGQSQQSGWRASELPEWTGPPLNEFLDESTWNSTTPSPFPGHRWLPVNNTKLDITDTPAGQLTYDSHGPGWRDWRIAAQTHYSFLQHLEEDALWRYKFNLWDYQYYRVSVNFIGFWGDDIVDAYPFPIADDEAYLTMQRPKELGRHVVLDGTVVSLHFAFSVQRRGPDEEKSPGGGLYHTDLLKRYKAYADEMVCPFPKRGHAIGGGSTKGSFWRS